MKTTLIVSLLCLSAIGSNAQDNEAVKRQMIHDRAVAIFNRTQGNMGPATLMHYNKDYTYNACGKSGNGNELAVTKERQVNGNMDVSRENTFLGYYTQLCNIYPNAPANAVPSVPSGNYTTLQSPPCYKYVTRKGLEVQECPGARFEPEHRR